MVSGTIWAQQIYMKNQNTKRVLITDRNAESLYLCGFPAFVLSNGSSLALFVGRVIDANVIIRKRQILRLG